MPITALPTPPSRSDSPADFSTKADALLGALPDFVTEANQLATDVAADKTAAAASATAASGSASAASSSATSAASSSSSASTSATNAANSASAAAASASGASSSASAAASSASAAETAAAAAGTQLIATSTTSLAVGTGSKSLTVETGKAFQAGQFALLTSGANWMLGQVTSYNSGTGALVVEVTDYSGSGTLATWNVSVSGARGATGPTGDPGANGTANIMRSARTSDTILAAGDNATLIDVTSGTFTQTFTAAATLASGWWCYVKNSGTGTITLDPNGAETIDGAATLTLKTGECRLVQCDGSGFYTTLVAGGAGMTLLSTAVASNSATVDFTGIDGTYDDYVVLLDNVVPASAAALWLRTSTDGGSSFDAGASDYIYGGYISRSAGTSAVVSNTGGSVINLSGGTSVSTTASDGGITGQVQLFSPSAAAYTHLQASLTFATSSTALSHLDISGGRQSAADVNAIRFLMSTGNIASGTFKLYGIKK